MNYNIRCDANIVNILIVQPIFGLKNCNLTELFIMPTIFGTNFLTF